MNLSTYLERSGLQQYAANPEFEQQVAAYAAELKLTLAQSETAEVQWQYQVPELGEGGACSLFGQLAAQPFDLASALGGINAQNTQMLQQVTALVAFYQARSASRWFGVYRKQQRAGTDAVLMKLAYFGAASRAEFPLTPEFAAISNNSTVGLSGQGRIINDVASYVAGGGEYYTCDPKVKAEACLPLLNEQGEVVGIIDSEAFEQNLFNGQELALLLAVVLALPEILRA